MTHPPIPGPGLPLTPPPSKPPVPRGVWLTVGVLVAAAVICFIVAMLLAPGWPQHSRGHAAPVSATTPADSFPDGSSPFLSVVEPALPPLPTDVPPITEYEVSTATSRTLPPTGAVSPAEISFVTATTPTASPSIPAPLSKVKAPGKLAILIDDMGLDVRLTRQAMDILPPEVSFAFLPYPAATPQLAQQASQAGHAILVHIPMQPLPHGPTTPDAGPNVLEVTDSSTTLATKLAANLAPLQGLAVGANNHMGSRFTGWQPGMEQVLAALAAKGLFFLDSRTIANTATTAAAGNISPTPPLMARDVFLDDTPTPQAVRAQLARAVQLAQKQGSKSLRTVIVIGHPHPATLQVLQAELPTLTEKTGVTLVSLVP